MTSFTTEMRNATKGIHAISDHLVNAKLFFALSNDQVWGNGLVVFYEIFKFLEDAMLNHRKDRIGKFILDGLFRKEAFESDLEYFFGENWTENYEIKEEVAAYLLNLRNIEKENPDLLIAYVYHLYLGLLSGGQILQRKRLMKNKLLNRVENNGQGYAVTSFENVSISSLKTQIKQVMNELAEEMTEEERNNLLEESKRVFEWNNKVIRSIEGRDVVFWQKISIFIFTILIICIIIRVIF